MYEGWKRRRPRSNTYPRRRATSHRRPFSPEPLEPRCLLAGGAPGDPDLAFGIDGLFSGAFETNHDELFEAAGQQQDGKLIFAGSSSAHGNADVDIVVARLNADGTPDTYFGGGGSVRIDLGGLTKQQLVEELVIDGLDRIIVVGETGNLTGGSVQQAFVLRLLPDGTPDSGFGNAGWAILPLTKDSSAQTVVLDDSGRIVVAGTYGTGSARDFFVGRLLSDGTPDPDFSGDGVTVSDIGGGNDTARDVAIAPGGKILVAGTILPNNGTPFRMGIARYNQDGTSDDSFGGTEPTTAQNVVTIGWEDFPGFSSRAVRATALAVQPQGQIVLAGTIPVGSRSDIAVARLDATGSLDSTFDLDGTLVFSIGLHDTEDATFGGPALALEQPDQNGDAQVLIGTTVWTNDPAVDSKFGVARISKEGSVDTSLGGYTVSTEFPGGEALHRLNDILLQADGRAVAAGGVWYDSSSAQDFQLAAARYLSDLGAAPIAEAGGPYNVVEARIVQLNAAESFQPDNATEALTYAWDFDGDGLFGEIGSSAVRGDEVGISPTFQAANVEGPSELVVRLRVTNERGLQHFGTATVNVLEATYTFAVDTFSDAPDAFLGDGIAADASGNVTLRAAVQEANADPQHPYTIALSGGTYGLTESGSETGAVDSVNDLDITGDIAIVGIGAGQTIIDAAGLASSPEKRPLEVRGGHLDLSRVTLTGGASSGGGGVYGFSSGSLDMSETAIVGNEAGSGGGIYVSGNVAVTITDSVITGNLGTSSVGGIRNDGAGTVTLTRSVVARNNDQEVAGNFTSGGNNLLGHISGATGFADGVHGDHVEQPSYVVTTFADSTSSDGTTIALRAAVMEANDLAGVQTIFVPSGVHRLTLSGTEAHYSPNDSVNDLDITGDMKIIGTGAGATIIDASGLASGTQKRPIGMDGGAPNLDLSRVTLTGGDSDYPGGAMIIGAYAKLNMREAALVGNEASTGGAIYIASVGYDVTITDSMITGNVGRSSVGGIRNSGSQSVTLTRTIVARNNNQEVYGPYISGGYNLVGNLYGTTGIIDGVNGDHVKHPSYVVTTFMDSTSMDVTKLALRAAVIQSNNTGGAQTIFVPSGTHRLALSYTGGTENDDSVNDLDIFDSATIIGTAAGHTIVDSSSLASSNFKRAFRVTGGHLDLSRVTLTGGVTTSSGGAIRVGSGRLDLRDSALVGNQAPLNYGGAIYADSNIHSVLTITDSVITGNGASAFAGGIANAGSASITVTRSVVANNTVGGSVSDAYGTFTSGGNNVLSSTSGATGFTDGVNGDLVQTPDYVVTGLFDTYFHADNGSVLSLREAIDLANNTAGQQTIFVPAWDFRLTRDGDDTGSPDTSVGDLDVFEDLELIGIATGETNIDSTAINDAVFEEIGTASLALSRLSLIEP